MTMVTLGTVAALRRFPVKSMLGESLEHCAVTSRGLDGDRAFALVDVETGKVATAKRPHLWRGLLAFSVEHRADGVRIVLPGGAAVEADEPDVDARLSAAIGRPVTLSRIRAPGAEVERAVPDEVVAKGYDSADVAAVPLTIAQAAPDGGFFDYAPVSVLTTSSLAHIAEAAAPKDRVALERYRPNIVVETPGLAPFAENDWQGRRLRIGDALELALDIPTPRCAIPMLAYADEPAATGAVAAVNKLNRIPIPLLGEGLFPCLGIFATVAAAGEVRVGDPVRLDG